VLTIISGNRSGSIAPVEQLHLLFDQSEAWNLNRLQTDCHEKWNYHNAFFFAGTLATTIGYGNNAPETKTGKIFCLVFILIGELKIT